MDQRSSSTLETWILPVDARRIGTFTAVPAPGDILDAIEIQLDHHSVDAQNLLRAAEHLRSSDIPVSFPTETVYGLGADATRSEAVKGIYRAKRRPADNPLIVHIASLEQLRSLLRPGAALCNGTGPSQDLRKDEYPDPIPEIYRPLISKFWPGPLTIILPNPRNSTLALEVTAGLTTFGARMPGHLLALALIQQAGVPLAAPSANASTKPSPTAAEHVAHDLDGRIEIILDGGPCDVGVESTVVDGLSYPPVILRPGGISLEQIQTCPGWDETKIGYKNSAEVGSQPRAPGMKYRHYSPKAAVVLFGTGKGPVTRLELCKYVGANSRLGLVRTRRWVFDPSREDVLISAESRSKLKDRSEVAPQARPTTPGFAGLLQTLRSSREPRQALKTYSIDMEGSTVQLFDVTLGPATADIARGIFAALRELDRENVDAIIVEGIDDAEGDTAAAVMNRLRKAAHTEVS